MIISLEVKKKLTNNWFIFLQSEICRQFQNLENLASKKKGLKSKKFFKQTWKKENKNEGGGNSFILQNGEVFDKVGVNQSTVSGKFKKEFASKILGTENNNQYWASGTSVVAHMKNPKIPALHFNTRFIVTSKDWFGGGIDATPCLNDSKEKIKFQNKLKEICKNNKKNYQKYKNWCDKYFYLPHHEEQRGIGGLFFDYETKRWENNFKFVRELGITFIDIAKSMVLNKINSKWTKKNKELQLFKRGKYVEFNLLYDRGTKFGLNSGGNVKSILMSLPPKPKWK